MGNVTTDSPISCHMTSHHMIAAKCVACCPLLVDLSSGSWKFEHPCVIALTEKQFGNGFPQIIVKLSLKQPCVTVSDVHGNM